MQIITPSQNAVEHYSTTPSLSSPSSIKTNAIYYSNWSMYDPLHPTLASQIPYDTVTDVNYAFMNVANDGTISLSDEWADIQVGTDWNNPDKYPYWGNLRMLYDVKQAALAEGRPFRTFFSVGGWGREGPLKAVAGSETATERFITTSIEMCQEYSFDGMDIDWEYPSQGDDPQKFTTLLQKLKTRFDAAGLKLTIATAAGFQNIDPLAKFWPTIAGCVDKINVMTYDYHGAWDNLTNYLSPLYPTEGDQDLNTTATMQRYVTYGVPKEKLIVGIPEYFRTFANATGGSENSHLLSPFTGPGSDTGSGDGIKLAREVWKDVQNGVAEAYWNEKAGGYSVYYPSTSEFASGIDLDKGIPAVCNFIVQNGFGGAMAWEFKGDDDTASATNRIYSLINPPKAHSSQRKTDFERFSPDISFSWKINLQIFILGLVYATLGLFYSDYNDKNYIKSKSKIIRNFHRSLKQEYKEKQANYRPKHLYLAQRPAPTAPYQAISPTSPDAWV